MRKGSKRKLWKVDVFFSCRREPKIIASPAQNIFIFHTSFLFMQKQLVRRLQSWGKLSTGNSLFHPQDSADHGECARNQYLLTPED